MGAFGNKFRKERERRGWTLEDVANVTKIGSRMLKAIEEEHFDLLPGGIFNKGFIRAYARQLELNDEEAVSQYLEVLQQAQIHAVGAGAGDALARPRSGEKPGSKPETNSAAARPSLRSSAVQSAGVDEELAGLQLPKAEHVRKRSPAAGSDRATFPWGLAVLAVLVGVVGIYLWNRHARGARAENSAQVTAATPASPAATPVSDSKTGTTNPAVTEVRLSSPAQATTVASQNPAVQRSPAAAGGTASHDASIRNPKPPFPASTAETSPSFTLVIRAAENSWISVTADGQPVIQETLIAPAHTSVRGHNEIVVKTGNAAAVSFSLNGKEFPPQGIEGEVKTFVFDAQGLKAAPAVQTSDAAR